MYAVLQVAAILICLPICSLPGQDERGGQNGIRRFTRKGPNRLVKTAEGDAAVLKRQATDQGTVGEECNVHRREGKQRVHDVGSRGANSEESDFAKSVQGVPYSLLRPQLT